MRGKGRDSRYAAAVREFKATFLAQVLREHGGNRTAAARALGLQRTFLQFLIKKFGLEGEKKDGRAG